MSFNIASLVLLVLGPVLIWRIYSRVKGAMGRQESVLSRHWLGVLVFGAALVVMLAYVGTDPMLLGCWAAGAAFGAGWGVYGLRKSRYQATPEGYFFVPYAPLGIAVAMLFVARMMYIGFDLFISQGTAAVRQPLSQQPLTVLVVGFAAAYFLAFSAGLLRWRMKH